MWVYVVTLVMKQEANAVFSWVAFQNPHTIPTFCKYLLSRF